MKIYSYYRYPFYAMNKKCEPVWGKTSIKKGQSPKLASNAKIKLLAGWMETRNYEILKSALHTNEN